MIHERRASRRRFLGASVGAVAALGAFARGAVPGPAGESAKGPQSPPFKIGVCDWMTGKGGTPDALRWAAEMGLDGVQLSFGDPAAKFDLRKPEVREQYRRVARETGVAAASLGMGVLNQIPYKSDPRTEQWVSDSVDVCAAMGLRVVLVAFFSKGDLRDDPAGVREVVARLKRVAPKAEKAGVYLGIESWLSAKEHLRIMDAVGSPNVMCYYDVGNSSKMGYDIYAEIRELGRRICEFHAKDYTVREGLGTGQVDFKRVRAAMDEIGYRGWIQLEGLSPAGRRDEIYRKDRDFLKGIFPASG